MINEVHDCPTPTLIDVPKRRMYNCTANENFKDDAQTSGKANGEKEDPTHETL